MILHFNNWMFTTNIIITKKKTVYVLLVINTACKLQMVKHPVNRVNDSLMLFKQRSPKDHMDYWTHHPKLHG